MFEVWWSIKIAMACPAWIVIDETRHPQEMKIMNMVRPLTALYFSPMALWLALTYFVLFPRPRQAM